MKNIEFDYLITKANGEQMECFTEAKLTDKNIKEVADFIAADKDHQTGELQDIPGHVYDRFMNAAYEDAIRTLKAKKDALTEDDSIDLQLYLPWMLIELLPDEVQDLLPDELFEDEEEADVLDGDRDVDPMGLYELEPPTKENSLYLTIKQMYFDQIVEGTKKEEYREIKDTTYKKYLEVDEEGFPLINPDLFPEGFDPDMLCPGDPLYALLSDWNGGNCYLVPKNSILYLNLAVGYNKERDTATVVVEDITFEPAKDKKGEIVRYGFDPENGNVQFSSDGPLTVWQAVFHLGEVVEVNRKK